MQRDRATRSAKNLALVTLPVLLLAGFAAATYTPPGKLPAYAGNWRSVAPV